MEILIVFLVHDFYILLAAAFLSQSELRRNIMKSIFERGLKENEVGDYPEHRPVDSGDFHRETDVKANG